MSAIVNDVAEAVREVRGGRMLIICDHPERENEGDFFMAAEKITIGMLNIMIQHGRGLICCPLTIARATALELPPQHSENTALHGTRFTVSVDAARCAGSGIPSADRVRTITTLADPTATASDFVRPGHIFPIVAHARGVVERAGHTEAAIALLRLAELQPVGVICEIIDDRGEMTKMIGLEKLAAKFEIKIVHVEQIRKYLQA